MSGAPDQPGVLSVGRLYCDLIFTDVPRMPSLGTEVFAGGFGLHAGGGAYITAAYFSMLGHTSKLASFLPAPPFRDLVASEIAQSGVDISLCRAAPTGLDPQVTVAMVTGGDRAFLTRRSGAPFPALSAADVRAAGARHVHIGELATLAEAPELIDAARSAGATVSLDCGWDENLAGEGLARLLSGVDVFLPNAAEMRRLAEIGLAGSLAPLTVIKRGAEGASAIKGGREVREDAVPVKAVDTTGAGDAFNAGFLSAWLAGRPLAACLAEGNAMGARAISGRGGVQATERGVARPGAAVAAR